MKYRHHQNEKGLVIPTALIFMSILLLLGGIAFIVTSTDLKIAGNYKVAEKAFYVTEAGISEARARLRLPASDSNRIADPVSGYDPWWSAYILTSASWQTTDDPGYNGNYRNYIPTTSSQTSTTIAANSLQSTLQYAVKIRHKREYDAEAAGHTTSSTHYYDGDGDTTSNSSSAPGNIVYYGYGNPGAPSTLTQFTTSGATKFLPVDIVTAFGTSGTGTKIIETEVVQVPAPPINSALYAKSNVTGNGTALNVDGNDNCGGAAPLPPIYTLAPATTTLNGSPVLNGNPGSPVIGSDDFNITDFVSGMKGAATVVLESDQNGANYGSSTNFITCYSNTSDPYNVGGLKLQNITGYGVLLVDGDLELGGGFIWNGVVLCTGVLTFNGGGAGVNILGAVLANQTVSINGGLDINYDSCMVENAFATQARKIVSWRQIY